VVKSCDNCWWCKESKTDENSIHFCTKYDVKVDEDIANKEADCDDFMFGIKAEEK
jgi:hypothetical protein